MRAHRGIKAAAIRETLQQVAEHMDERLKQEGFSYEVPSLKTIRRRMAEFEGLQEEVKQFYDTFSWPRAMLIGALPWEAGRPALEFLHWWNQTGHWLPPSVGLVKWFARVTTIAPDAPIDDRHDAAKVLWGHELTTGRGEEASQAQFKAVQRVERWLSLLASGSQAPVDPDFVREAMALKPFVVESREEAKLRLLEIVERFHERDTPPEPEGPVVQSPLEKGEPK
jgi:hypothetical protein